MHQIKTASLLLLLLTACAEVTPMHDGEGGLKYVVGCYGVLTPMSVCYAKAAELCPAGYTIIDQTQRVTYYDTPQADVTRLARQLAIACNPLE